MDNRCRQKTEVGRRMTDAGDFPISDLRSPTCVLRPLSTDLRPLSTDLCPASAVLGFTLVELIVVLLIISVTIAVVAPRVGSNWKQIEDSDFLQQFTETIQRSRLFAMNCGQPVAFRLNGSTRVYGFQNPPRQPIPLNADLFRASAKGAGNRRFPYHFLSRRQPCRKRL